MGGQLAGAKEALERSIDIIRTSLGPLHWEMMFPATNLGVVLVELGDLDGARELTELAIAVDLRARGEGAQITSGHQNNMGLIAYQAGDLDEALRRQQAAAAAVGPDNPASGNIMIDLATVLAALGRSDEARRAFAAGFAFFDAQHFEPQHRERGVAHGRYATAMLRWGELDGAAHELDRANEIITTSVGPRSPDLVPVLLSLGELHLRERDPDAAQRNYALAREITADYLGGSHPSLAAAQVGLDAAMALASNQTSD
jgi:tetratricopeptide (TPR) repeat protein